MLKKKAKTLVKVIVEVRTFYLVQLSIAYSMLAGPLIKCNGEKATLVGLVSFGIGCASGYPGVYTNIANFIDWRKDNVEDEDVMI